MTTITFYKENKNITGFECIGHTNFAQEGSDILCSAISALTQGVCLGVVEVLKLKANIENKDGYLKLDILESEDRAQDLLKTLKISLEDIMKENEKYIRIMEIKRSKK